MKNKTLALMTAALITASALILTAGLSFLNSSAIEEIPENSAISDIDPNVRIDVVPEVMPELDPEVMPEVMPEPEVDPEAEPETEPEAGIDPNVRIDVVPEVMPELDPEVMPETVTDYPVYEYTLGDPRNVYVDGENVRNGVVIDIYSHKTGKLVGQMAFSSGDISKYISELMREEFKPENELSTGEDTCQPLPAGDYRVEVYAGTWFSYTYGNSGIYELTQCTLTFSGCEKLTGYIDFLIADYIAEIEAGNVTAPAPEMAVSKLLYEGIEGYWEGYYNEVCNMYIPAAGRLCERFPYLETEE